MIAVTHIRRQFFTLATLVLLPGLLLAHGSVTSEDDLCVIRIGFYSAHFKVFQPRSSGSREYCEDLPDTGESIFVMEYLHQLLGQVPIEFRIIRNTTGLGNYAKLEDVQAISDLEAITVFHRPPMVEQGVYTINHAFAGEGDFLGVVSARHPETEEQYMAVFPFHVGSVDLGWLPLIVGLALAAQLGFLASRGALKRRGRGLQLLLLGLSVALAHPVEAQESRLSEGGMYRATLHSEVEPVPLNRIHRWRVHLETADGLVVDDAELSLEGGMPAHNHGLPTEPEVGASLGDGNYPVSGVRFHMMGQWELVLHIRRDGRDDRVIIPFSL